MSTGRVCPSRRNLRSRLMPSMSGRLRSRTRAANSSLLSAERAGIPCWSQSTV